MITRTTLPGFHAPAAGFEAPFELLEACHERVQRSLSLLSRLVEHVAARGHDAHSRSAAADVLRYFDIAAPLHHEDEERHVFPPLERHPDAAVRAAVERLRADHRAMTAAWQRLRPILIAWRDEARPAPVDEAAREAARAFAGLYGPHIDTEETLVYPAARAGLEDDTLQAMGAEMQSRRRTEPGRL